jgi:drug/metabolite transporter (DMT)-like permease
LTKNYLLLGFLVLIACCTPIFAKLAVAEISPLSLGFIRFGMAAVLFYITSKIRKVSLTFERKDYGRLILLAALCIPLNQFFFLNGIKSSYASHSGIIYSLNPVYAYVIAVLIKSERFSYGKLTAILMTVVGIFFVFYENFTSATIGAGVIHGDFYLLLAVLTFSLYLTLGKAMIEKYGALKVTTFAFVAGTFLDIPFFIYDFPNFTLAHLTATGITAFFFLLLVSYLGYLAWYYALKKIEVSKATTLSNISPLLTVLFSVIFLGETISIYFIIGGVITIAGVFIMHRINLELA